MGSSFSCCSERSDSNNKSEESQNLHKKHEIQTTRRLSASSLLSQKENGAKLHSLSGETIEKDYQKETRNYRIAPIQTQFDSAIKIAVKQSLLPY